MGKTEALLALLAEREATSEWVKLYDPAGDGDPHEAKGHDGDQ